MNPQKSNRLNKIISSVILHCFSLIYGFVFWLCLYWFLRFDTWSDRIIYISITILITKFLTASLAKLLILFSSFDEK